MKSIRTLLFMSAIAFIIAFSGFNSNAQEELVVNGGFETGDFTGWNTEFQPSEVQWFVYTGTISPLSVNNILAPPEGEYAAVSDQRIQGASLLYQDIVIPPGARVTCSAIVYYTIFTQFNIAGPLDDTITPFNQQYRIDIMDPNAPLYDTGAGVLLNLFEGMPLDPLSLGYTTLDFNLSQFAGSTVRIRAAVTVTSIVENVSIDAVSCIATLPRNVPTLSEWGLIGTAAVLGFIGFIAMTRRKATT